MKNFILLMVSVLCSQFILFNFTYAHGEEKKTGNTLISQKNSIPTKEKRIQEVKNIDLDRITNRTVLLKLESGSLLNVNELGLSQEKISSVLEEKNYVLVRVPKDINYESMLSRIRALPYVINAEPNYEKITTFQPNDPDYNKQWYLEKINVTKAWDVTRGSDDIIVAVLDSGVDSTHIELTGKVLPGYDFVNRDANPADDNGHGTKIAGLIAANQNSIGIAGIAQKVKILPVKIANDEGVLSDRNILEGLIYAIEQGADIINMSYSGYDYNSLEEEVLNEAHEKGITLIAASGNDDSTEYAYPASYPHVISVGASNNLDYRSYFSNYGDYQDIVAPGENIFSTDLKNTYSFVNGTSFSAPIVSGVASLIKARNPSWGPSEIEWALEKSARKNSIQEWNPSRGFGRIDAYQALLAVPNPEDDRVKNTIEEATQLINKKEVQERINLPNDMDYYMFKTTEPSTVSITITDVAPSMDMSVFLETSGEIIDLIDNGSYGEDEFAVYNLEAGTYYLRVFDYNHRWSDTPYHVSLNLSPNGGSTGLTFTDVTMYQEEIEYLSNLGIITGYSDNTFKPDGPIKRLQAVQMILREMGIGLGNSPNPNFSDVKPGDYGYDEIAKAAELGIISGKTDGRFDPWGTLTRAQMAKIMAEAYNLQGTYDKSFFDIPKGYWAENYIYALASNGITTGYAGQVFHPNEKLKRKHFALFMYRILQ